MPDKRELEVNDKCRKPDKRLVKTLPITFVCEECGEEVTEKQVPGGQPKYCDHCIRLVRKRQNRERVRQYQERKRKRAE